MPTTYGGIYYPTGPVRIVFSDVVLRNDPAPYSYIDLPTPSVRKLIPNREIIEKESYTGALKFKDRGYKPTLELEWQAPGDTDISKLLKLADYKEPVTIFPFFTGTVGQPSSNWGYSLRMKLIECDSVPFGGKNVRVVFKFKFKAMRYYSKLFNLDDLTCIIRGAFLIVNTPTGRPDLGISAQMFVRPLARRPVVGGILVEGYPCQKIFCFQPGFN